MLSILLILGIILLLGLIVGGLVWAVREDLKTEQKSDKGFSKIKEHNEEKQAEKEEHLKNILDFMADKAEVRNNDIEKLLSVSDATATRYMDELEKQGKITQTGQGNQASYQKAN